MGYRTPLQGVYRYNRYVHRSTERNSKRQLPFHDSQSRPDIEGAKLILHLSATSQTPRGNEHSRT